MNQWTVREHVHVENETSVGRRMAAFRAGLVVPQDQGEDELLAHLATIFVDVGTPESPRLVPLAERGDEIEAPPADDHEPAKDPKPRHSPRRAPKHAAGGDAR